MKGDSRKDPSGKISITDQAFQIQLSGQTETQKINPQFVAKPYVLKTSS